MEEITVNKMLRSIDKQKTRLIKAIEDIYENIEAAEQFLRDIDYNKPIRPGSEPNNNIQWHNLRIDKNDLPDDFGRLQNVIAWCEPKFEEIQNAICSEPNAFRGPNAICSQGPDGCCATYKGGWDKCKGCGMYHGDTK